jgi:hypothetical protein
MFLCHCFVWADYADRNGYHNRQDEHSNVQHICNTSTGGEIWPYRRQARVLYHSFAIACEVVLELSE